MYALHIGSRTDFKVGDMEQSGYGVAIAEADVSLQFSVRILHCKRQGYDFVSCLACSLDY